MPELPEVETVRRTLGPALDREVTKVWAARTTLRSVPIAGGRIRRLTLGTHFTEVRRWGKYLLLDLAERDGLLVCHLGMTGRLRVQSSDDERSSHTHLVLSLSGGFELRYSDPRRFGHLSIAQRGREREHPPLAVLGIDALADEVDGTFIRERAQRTTRSLKQFLLDQSVLAGLGNIYVSESLWGARIKPTLPANRLSAPRADVLARAIRHVLDSALTRGGTSLRDFIAADGAYGENVHYLRVYDRDGEPCARPECPGTIRRTVIQGRSTFHCPRCQSR